jgi:hypothetical protein
MGKKKEKKEKSSMVKISLQEMIFLKKKKKNRLVFFYLYKKEGGYIVPMDFLQVLSMYLRDFIGRKHTIIKHLCMGRKLFAQLESLFCRRCHILLSNLPPQQGAFHPCETSRKHVMTNKIWNISYLITYIKKKGVLVVAHVK